MTEIEAFPYDETFVDELDWSDPRSEQEQAEDEADNIRWECFSNAFAYVKDMILKRSFPRLDDVFKEHEREQFHERIIDYVERHFQANPTLLTIAEQFTGSEEDKRVLMSMLSLTGVIG